MDDVASGETQFFVADETLLVVVVAAESVSGGSDPHAVGTVDGQGADRIAADGGRVVAVVFEVFEPIGAGIEGVDAVVGGSDPDLPVDLR